MSGRRITERMKIDSLLTRAEHVCPICRKRILPGERIEWDHVHATVFDGPHAYDNLRPLHYECHKWKTRQDVKANAKVKRLKGLTRQGNKKTIRSRGFDTRYKRKIGGEVERRT